MESQPGARSTLVDPFGRELEEWLRDAPATHTPYVADLVVPPVTGPLVRPVAVTEEPSPEDVAGDSRAFRRERGRHASACTPAFPEPPERFALRFEQLAVEVAAASGRTVIERIVFLESEVRRRESDLARLAAWESTVADSSDPEVDAAREYARAAFADIIADAAAETALLERRAARRAERAEQQAERDELLRLIGATRGADRDRTHGAGHGLQADTADTAEGSDPGPGTSAGFAPVSATTRPTPLVQPAAGSRAADRRAVEAAVRAHTGEQPVVLVPEHLPPAAETEAGDDATRADAVAEVRPADDAADAGDGPAARPGWWARVVASLLRMLGRR